MLSDEQIQKVRLVLAGDGWNHVMKPAIANRGRMALKALTLTRSERAKEFKGSDFDTEDDVLRATIRECEWMCVCWDNEVQVHDQNRQRDELDGRQPVTANP
jgi:hypothetical protein